MRQRFFSAWVGPILIAHLLTSCDANVAIKTGLSFSVEARPWEISAMTPNPPMANDKVTISGKGFSSATNIRSRLTCTDGSIQDAIMVVSSSITATIQVPSSCDHPTKVEILRGQTVVASRAFATSEAQEMVVTPGASPSAGTYSTAQVVTLSTSSADAIIYYTVDGSTPTRDSLLYSSAIMVAVSQTIKAIAVKANFTDSLVSSFEYTINGTVATPTFSVGAGAYGPSQTVEISTATSGATIYYTTNGTDPTTASSVYSSAITVSSTATLKAFATKANFSNSAIASAAYTINGTVATPTFSVLAGSYGPSQSVTISTATSGTTIYYTTDGSDPTTTSSVYSSAITVSSTSTIKALATKANFSNSAIAAASYTINGAVATPTFSVPAGSYGPSQTVEISTATSGATIYYTTNGTDPATASSVYSSAITVSSTATLKAFATKANFSNSAIASAAYTINGTVATPMLSKPGGTYNSRITVTFSSTTSGSSFYYTVDGSNPSCSQLGTETSGSSVAISSGLTLNVIGCKANYADSPVTSATYSILWGDVTKNGSGQASDCTGNPENCTYRLLSEAIDWRGSVGNSSSWSAINSACSQLTHNGISGWRLPTVSEINSAYAAGLTSLPEFSTLYMLWSSDNSASQANWCSYYGGCVSVVYEGGTQRFGKEGYSSTDYICVRDWLPKIQFSSPSPQWLNPTTSPGAISTFTLTFTEATSITLSTNDISTIATGTAAATVYSVTGTGNTRSVVLSGFSGTGDIFLSVAANTAANSFGAAKATTSSTLVNANGPLWADVTVNEDGSASDCASRPTLCTMQLMYSASRPSGSATLWRKSDGVERNYADSAAYCQSLGAGWHMPLNSEFTADLADGLYDRLKSVLNLKTSGYWAQNTDIATCASNGGCLWSLQNRSYSDRWVEYSAEIVCAK